MLSEDLPEERGHAERAYSRQEWADLHSHVHRVNGSASFCKLEALKVICIEIEAGLKLEQPPSPEAMQGFSREISRVLAALKGFSGAK